MGRWVGCPAAMFRAAFTSAWSAKPQAVHTKRAWLSRDSASTCPHAEHRWLVNAGLIFSTRPGALSSSLRASSPQPERRISRLSPVFCRTFWPGAPAVKRDAIRLHLRRHRAGPAEPYPSGLWDAHLAHAAGQAAHLTGPDGDNPESLVPAGLPPRRTVMRAVQVICQGLGEVAQRLLLHHLRACGQPRVLRAGGGELPTLLQVARSARAPRAPMSVLLDREIPNVPGVAAVFPQHRLLGGRGDQTIPGHTNTLANDTDISREIRRRFLSNPRAEVSTPRS